MIFYLGTHHPRWLESVSVPLFISNSRLSGRKKLPRACVPWALDSGGFSELSQHGLWRTGAKEYANEVRRYAQEIGNLQWAAPQDWMCSEDILKKTGLSVACHQRNTVQNFLELRDKETLAPIVPVLQGLEKDDYLRHVELYDKAGVALSSAPLVGLGSVVRKQKEAGDLILALRSLGVTRLHGFGFKKTGIRLWGSLLESADSLAWSYSARRDDPMEGCTHKTCANCLRYALAWRETLIPTKQLFLL